MGEACGYIDYKLELAGENRATMFELDQKKNTLTLKPDDRHMDNTYTDVLLSFFYTQFPD